MPTEEKKKRGRPSLAADERKSSILKFRARGDLVRRMSEAAAESGRSVSEEIEHRLDRSFQKEDVFTEALGGPALRDITLGMLIAFRRGAKSAAGNPDWTANDWLNDKDCYRTAMLEVFEHLLDSMPDPILPEEDMSFLKAAIESKFMSMLMSRGMLKFDFGDGRGPVGSGFIPPKKDDQQ